MSLQDIEIKKEYRSRLDNVARDFYIPLLKEAVSYKRSVGFFSSSILVEISKGIIGLINNGRIIEHKTMEQIDNLLELNQKVQFLCNYPNYAALLLKKKYVVKCNVVGNSVLLNLKEQNIAPVISYLVHKKIKIYSIKKVQKSLEELYFELLNADRPSSSVI